MQLSYTPSTDLYPSRQLQFISPSFEALQNDELGSHNSEFTSVLQTACGSKNQNYNKLGFKYL